MEFDFKSLDSQATSTYHIQQGVGALSWYQLRAHNLTGERVILSGFIPLLLLGQIKQLYFHSAASTRMSWHCAYISGDFIPSSGISNLDKPTSNLRKPFHKAAAASIIITPQSYTQMVGLGRYSYVLTKYGYVGGLLLKFWQKHVYITKPTRRLILKMISLVKSRAQSIYT